MKYLAILLASTLVQAVDYGFCKANGQNGVCVSTSSCSSAGGKRTAGLCPGDASIQCCTYGTCQAKGLAGTCESTSTCKGTSTAGLCPGPANIQCCTSSNSGNSCPPALNSASISLIKSYEGFRGSPYIDATGHPTVGYGHLCSTKGCTELGYDYPISETEGQALLQKDLKKYEKCLDAAVKVKLNANQYGALTSWTFNMGCGAMQGSTLVKRLNEGDSPNTVAAEELPKWVKGGGQTLPGLVKRRAAEVKLFRTETSVGAIPC